MKKKPGNSVAVTGLDTADTHQGGRMSALINILPVPNFSLFDSAHTKKFIAPCTIVCVTTHGAMAFRIPTAWG